MGAAGATATISILGQRPPMFYPSWKCSTIRRRRRTSSNLPSGIDLPEVSLSGLAHVYESIWGHL